MSTIKLPLEAVDNHPGEQLVNETLEALVNNNINSRDAAQKIDAVIISDLKRANTDSRPLGWEHYLWDSIGRSAMVIPADHAGQDNLVKFLQDIQLLPKTTIAYHESGEDHEKVFWTLNAENGYSGLAQWLWELKEGEIS
jgi:Cft2 family RNA processing exonuclease